MTGCRQRWRPLCRQQRSPRRALHLHRCHLICGAINGGERDGGGQQAGRCGSPGGAAPRGAVGAGQGGGDKEGMAGGCPWWGAPQGTGTPPTHLQGETHQERRKHAMHQQTSHSFEAEGRPDSSGSPPKIRIKRSVLKASYTKWKALCFILKFWNSSIFLLEYSFSGTTISIYFVYSNWEPSTLRSVISM